MVAAQAGSHLVTPMMAPALVDHADVFSDIREYFASVRTLAAHNAGVLRSQIAEIASALRGGGAQPLLGLEPAQHTAQKKTLASRNGGTRVKDVRAEE